MIDTRLIADCQSVLAIAGKLNQSLVSVCTDSRRYEHPALFIAFPGAKHNPLDYADDLLRKGCPILVYQKSEENEHTIAGLRKIYADRVFVAVRDAVSFTQELGALHVRQWQATGGVVFAISGSNGKTTHKEMLAFMLKKVLPGQIVATEKNNNNHLGVPLTLLQIRPETKICVLELGSNHPGEIKVLCDIANPDAGIVTNIGATHLEFFGTEHAVFLEEGYLYQAIAKGPYFQNMDDAFLRDQPRRPSTVSYSTKDPADLRFKIGFDHVEVSGLLGTRVLRNSFITGAHNFLNLATAWSIAASLAPEHSEALSAAAAEFRPTANRSEWVQFGEQQVYLDAYNANPSSMKAAIAGFFDWLSAHNVSPSSAVVVLGDMNELGDGTPQYHREVAEFLKQWPAAQVIFVGRFAAHYVDGLGGGLSYANALALKGSEWARVTQGKRYALIKGSRSLQLESLIAIT